MHPSFLATTPTSLCIGVLLFSVHARMSLIVSFHARCESLPHTWERHQVLWSQTNTPPCRHVDQCYFRMYQFKRTECWHEAMHEPCHCAFKIIARSDSDRMKRFVREPASEFFSIDRNVTTREKCKCSLVMSKEIDQGQIKLRGSQSEA